ncbi:AbrB/MazE/SpoVT family DNA-binding domain-containing protein [Gottfriedia solisilvae]|uniref:Transition state regulator Abh n=1 Tax=Gottfriedia solisilvae TaxID=1516104 RepID=A0A8J3F242_9BACI|nr:AbrB/MazE/SpoVT family DNA-binding domain-containing protein [Gottfriedia solisilvae]GGI18007.1 transition state regulator Abh [Gottfriedia solisilvae]
MNKSNYLRKVDELGRIVIPKEIRKRFNILERDQLEIKVSNKKIIIEKYEFPISACMITNQESKENLTLADGKIILSKLGAEILRNELEVLLSSKK